MENLDGRLLKVAQSYQCGADPGHVNPTCGAAGDPAPVLLRPRHHWKAAGTEWRAGEIYRDLSPDAMNELELVAAPLCHEGTDVLFAEEQEARSLMFLLEGQVKLTMNSSGGRRLTLGIAVPGDVLGLAAVVTGCPYEITAVARFPCRTRTLARKSFLSFLLRNPVAWQNSARLMGFEYQRRCEQLRILGLASSAPMKLAMLLLQWCSNGQLDEPGARIHCPLSHEEIGEFIGLSRETVTRNLGNLKDLNLVEQHGAIFFIHSLAALEFYAGQSSC